MVLHLCLACAALAPMALSGQGPDKSADAVKSFRLGDADKDGKLSKAELLKLAELSPKLKGKPDLARQVFDKLDADGDGHLTLDEYQKAFLPETFTSKEPAVKTQPAEKPPTAEQTAYFEKHIPPVLVDHCYKCHSAKAEKIRGKFVLDTREGLRKGGESGPVIVPGDPKKSLLIRSLHHPEGGTRMPPKAKLP